METRIVKTRAELKKAVKDNVDIIQIDKTLEKDLRPLFSVMKLSTAQRIAVAGFLATSAAGIIASLALSPATSGLSGIIGVIASAPAIITFAAESGTSAIIIAGIVLLCVFIGVEAVVHLLRTYDLEESEGEISFSGFHYRFKKKYSQKHSAK